MIPAALGAVGLALGARLCWQSRRDPTGLAVAAMAVGVVLGALLLVERFG